MTTKTLILLGLVWAISFALALGTYELLTAYGVSTTVALINEALVGFVAGFYGAHLVFGRDNL